MKEAPEGPGEGGIREATLWSECVSGGSRNMVQRQKSEPLWKYGAISLTIMISFSRAWLYNKRVKGMRRRTRRLCNGCNGLGEVLGGM